MPITVGISIDDDDDEEDEDDGSRLTHARKALCPLPCMTLVKAQFYGGQLGYSGS